MAHSIISISDSQVNGADQVLVADSNSKIPAVDGSQLTLLNATTVTSGTIASARLDVGTTANKIIQLDGNAKLPAVDASQLTGIVSATISANDPTISTNPSGGVGTEWNNSTSGEMYICTDATAGANVWTNVGEGTGDIQPWLFGGTNRGFAAGNESSNVIDSFSFASDGNAIDHGDLTVARSTKAGHSSSTHGYVSSGSASAASDKTIDKFTFASTGNATDVGDLTQIMTNSTGQSSETYGFTSGGDNGPTNNVINKFSFSADGNATDHGDITVSRRGAGGQSSTTHGYTSGGHTSSASNVIDKFTFASTGNATDVGNLTVSRRGVAGSHY